MSTARTRPTTYVSITEPQEHPDPNYPTTLRTISVHLNGQMEPIGWVIHRPHDDSAPYEVLRYGGSSYGSYPSWAAAKKGAQQYGHRYAALPAGSPFDAAVGPADDCCSTCGQRLPDTN